MSGLAFRRSVVPAVGALIWAVLSGCGDLLQEPDTGIATNLTLVAVSGDDQTGPPGSPLPLPIRVRLVDLEGGSTDRLWVEWVVVQGSGSVEPRHSFTDPEGVAEASWRLGTGTGKQRLEARVGAEIEVFEAEICEACPAD